MESPSPRGRGRWLQLRRGLCRPQRHCDSRRRQDLLRRPQQARDRYGAHVRLRLQSQRPHVVRRVAPTPPPEPPRPQGAIYAAVTGAYRRRSMPFSIIAALIAGGFVAFHFWYWKQADRTGRGASFRDTSRLTVLVLAPVTIVLLVIGLVQVVTR